MSMIRERIPHNLIVLVSSLLILLVGCSAEQVSRSADVISSFRTTRGKDATYQVGDNITFSFRLARAGYTELEIRDPDGEVYILQNLSGYAPAGERTLPEPDSPYALELGEPTGEHTVTLHYRNESARPSVTDSATLTFEVAP